MVSTPDRRPTLRRGTAIASSNRSGVSLLMAAVLLAAIDFAIVNSLEHYDHARDAAIVTLPMISLLILTLRRLRKSNRSFWVGFHVAGWLTTSVFGYLAWEEKPWFYWPLSLPDKMLPGFSVRVNALDDSVASTIFLAVILLIYTTPLVLISVITGWLAASWNRMRRASGGATNQVA